MSDDLDRYLGSLVGRHTVAHARRPPRKAHLLEVVDAHGARFFAKRHAATRKWRNEVRAYRTWSPRMGGLMPRLLATDEETCTLVTAATRGRHVHYLDPGLHHAAGITLRRLHTSAAAIDASSVPGYSDRVVRSLEDWLRRGRGLLTAAEVDFARDQTARLADLRRDEPLVPCHGDYRPANWLIDEAGTARAVDFADSRWSFRSGDLVRLYYRSWWERPALARAFLAGYGTSLTAAEHELVRLQGPLITVVKLVIGHRRGQPHEEESSHARLADLMAGRSPVDLSPAR